MFTYMAGRPMCDKISMALASQALSALSINDFKGAWRLADELKRRWARELVEPDPKQLDHKGDDEADGGDAPKKLRFQAV